jgi:dTDP-4-amino-4,6-dideoxygalactose transaminase
MRAARWEENSMRSAVRPAPQHRVVQIALPSTGEEEWAATREPLVGGWLTQGPKVAEFEKRFAARHGVKHALATTSATTGLHLALVAMGIGPGDEVIVPAFTWVATPNVVLYCGATPVFCDVDRTTFNVDTTDLKKRVTPRTKAVIPVHLFGLCADVAAIRAAVPAGVRILEDAACAAGAASGNIPAGALGDAGVFSFHPRKSITTGEGGMLTTNDDALAETAGMLRNHGASISEEQRHAGPRPYLLPDFNLLGFNYRLTDLQGAVGIVQLGKLDAYIDERAKWAAWYRKRLAALDWLRCPEEPENGRHAWQAFVCYVDPNRAPAPRNEMMERLQALGVSTRPGTHACHMLGLYRDRFGLSPDDFPGARDCDRNTMAIPLHNRMNEADYEHVAACLESL